MKKLSPTASQRDSQSEHTSFRTRGVTGFLVPNEHIVLNILKLTPPFDTEGSVASFLFVIRGYFQVHQHVEAMSECWLGGATRVTELRLALPQNLQFVKSNVLTMSLSKYLTPYKVLTTCECSLLIHSVTRNSVPSLLQKAQHHNTLFSRTPAHTRELQ